MLSRRESIVAFAFAVIISFILTLGIYSVHEIQRQRQSTKNIYDHPFTVSNAVREIRFQMASIHDDIQELAAAASPEKVQVLIRQIDEHERRIKQLFKVVHERFLGNMAMIDKAETAFLDWRPLRQQEIALAITQRMPAAETQIVRQDSEYLARLDAVMDPILAYAMNKADFFYIKAFRQSAGTLSKIYLLMAFLSIVAVAIAIYIVIALRRAQRAEKHYLEIISQNERRYRELLNAAPDGVVIVDSQQRIHMVNRHAEQMFGYGGDELVGRSIDVLVPEELRGNHGGGIDAYFTNPVARNLRPGRRLRGRRKDGSEFPASISLGPVVFEGETLVTAMVRDISNELETEKKLRQAHKMEAIGTVVGGVAHEFNNILAGIVGNIYLAKLRLDAADEPHIRHIEEAIQRAAAIVQKLMYFAHKGILRMKGVQLAELVRRCVAEVADSIPIAVDIQCDAPGCCTIKGDEEQVEQAILGVLSNAVDAVADVDEPRITVSLKRIEADDLLRSRLPESDTDAYACLVFEDNGAGISPEDMEHIFEPFYSTKEVGEGSGLGLPMIHGVIESHGGLVTVESEPDQGCTVTICLPLLQEKRARERAAGGGEAREEGASLPGEVRTVLIADDEAPVREILEPVLESMNYRVLTAVDGAEAVELFRAHREEVSLLILDVLMPRLDGAEAARRIREMAAEVPIIFITGYDKQALEEYHLDRLPHVRFLTKPFEMELLQETVESMHS